MVIHLQDEILHQIDAENMSHGVTEWNALKNEICYGDNLLSIMHVNIRSLNKNIDNLLIFLESYELVGLDIIVLSETFQLGTTKNCYVQGYQTLYNEAKYNKNDGILILVKNNINFEFTCPLLPTSRATLARIVFELKNVKIGMTAIYKPPPIPKVNFIADLKSFLEHSTNSNIEIIIGDININILDTNDDNVVDYLSALESWGFESYINSVTRPDSGTSLDHIFVKQKLKSNIWCFKSCTVDTDISDHNPVILNISRKEVMPKNTVNERISITNSKINISKFKKDLSEFDWTIVTGEGDPEISTEMFLNAYRELLQNATETFTTINKHKKLKKWITNGIITSIKNRDKMKKRLTNNYNLQLKDEYKKYRNTLNKIIHKQKNDYYKSQIARYKNNMKKLYEIIKDATYEVKNKTNENFNIKNSQDEAFESETEMAHYCNEYFINIGLEMERVIPQPRTEVQDVVRVDRSIYLTPITKNEIIKHISSLKNNSSPGYDGIKTVTIKQTHIEIIEPLLHIFNRILETGIVPKPFKTSIVIPIYKSGVKTSINNYRPISLISNFAKILEKCIKERFSLFFKINNVLSPNQFGFVEGRNTSDAMHRLVTEIVNHMNLDRKCIAVFLDLAKAFDTVPHAKLLNVLERNGIRGLAYNLMNSYLSERFQMVKLNNTLSSRQLIKIGIPQGTVLGPILFITYINSLLSMEVDGLTISFADDTVLVFSGDEWEDLRETAMNGLKIIGNWLENYKLTLNLTKTQYIAFSLTVANRPPFHYIEFNDHIVKEVTHAKYLGIVIDQFLKWHFHVDYVANKIRKLVHKFYLLREFLDQSALVMIYKALVESIIRYGIVVWGGLYNNNLHKLNIIQKYILKIMYKRNKRYPTDRLFSVKTSNIKIMYITAICAYVHTHKDAQIHIAHKYDTRARTLQHLKMPQSHNNLHLRYLNYIGPKFYNLLPIEIRKEQNKNKFIRKCNGFVFENSFQFEGFLD